MITQATTSAGIAIASVAAYQISIKAVPGGINPINALVTFYVTALVCTLIAAKFVPVGSPDWSLASFSWAAVLVGIAIVGIELGYLLMYRNGWDLAAAPLVVMGGAAVLLVLAGSLLFRQPWSARYLLGIALCLAGIYLLTPRE